MSAVNRESGLIFIHVPKCAGSVMEQLPWIGDAGHAPAAEIRRRIGPEAWNKLFSFGFVRNPFDRLVSAYFHFVQKPLKENEHPFQQDTYRSIKKLHGGVIASGLDTKEAFRFFAHDILPARRDFVNHFRPQTYFLCGQEGDTLVNYVGRFESLQSDFNEVCKRLGRDASSELPRGNSTVHQHWGEYYDSVTAGLVRMLYAGDFRRWYPHES